MNTQTQSNNTFNSAAQAQSAPLAAAIAAPATDKAALQVSDPLLVLDVISEEPNRKDPRACLCSHQPDTFSCFIS